MEGPREIVTGVHGLGSDLVNWYLVADDGRLTAVDAGLPGFAKRLEADLAAIGVALADVEAVILTHSDADHTGLAATLRDAGASVHIHADDDGTLRKPGPKGGDASPIRMLSEMWRPSLWRFYGGMARAGGARPPKIEGASTFSDGDVLEVPGRPWVIHTPGHTLGHCAFHFERHGALFVGDALMTWNPLTGERGPRLMPARGFNVSNATALESLAVIEGVDAEVMLVGHGDPWHEGPAAAVAQAREAATS
jgi:glyoxylase-like metal-dependent hydrolase (beta-lactamase superfamily II)